MVICFLLITILVDDALYAAVRFVNMMARSNRKLSDIIDDLPKVFNTPELDFFKKKSLNLLKN